MLPFNPETAIVHDYFADRQRLVTDDQKNLFYLVKPSDGLWLKIQKIRRYKKFARLFGEFYQQGRVWNGYYDFRISDEYDGFSKKVLNQIEALLKNLAS
jgi:hypothetical protein